MIQHPEIALAFGVMWTLAYFGQCLWRQIGPLLLAHVCAASRWVRRRWVRRLRKPRR
jgi:hypothetical protein